MKATLTVSNISQALWCILYAVSASVLSTAIDVHLYMCVLNHELTTDYF